MNKELPMCLQKHVKDELKAYTQYYYAEDTKAIRKIIIAELNDRIDNAIKLSEKKDKYEIAAWSEYQADAIGYRRALREIINLLDHER